jgi:hypothetical protein
MRIWSLHPRLLDARGLVALWRETLLAQKVLSGQTKGYRHHPQLERFQSTPSPLKAIGAYLFVVYGEASERGYKFDSTKIKHKGARSKISVTRGQVLYEFKHLKRKVKVRDPLAYKRIKAIKRPATHPLFTVIAGTVERWERVKASKLANN